MTEIHEADAQLRQREGQGRAEEAAIREKLLAVEAELGGIRAERAVLAGRVSPPALAEYEKVLRARGGLAVAQALPSQICAGCRMAIRPQAILELRAQSRLLTCESCGRFLFWRDSA